LSLKDEYPEHSKLSAVQRETQAIHSFLEWLGDEKGYFIAEWDKDHPDGNMPFAIRENHTTLVAEFYEIDLKAFDNEKRDMIEKIRSQRETDQSQVPT
jgi:hypothetical protein